MPLLASWRPAPFLGAGLLLFPLLLGPIGCGPRPGEAPDPETEGARDLGLRTGSRLHRVVLGGRGSEEHVLPQRIQAGPGDAVEFVTVDHRVHTVAFVQDSIPARAWDFLLSTGQDVSPPLLSSGSRFLVRLDGAPPGRYLFRSRGHGGQALGVIELGVTPDNANPSSD